MEKSQASESVVTAGAIARCITSACAHWSKCLSQQAIFSNDSDLLVFHWVDSNCD